MTSNSATDSGRSAVQSITVIEPRSRWLSLDVAELWRHRELLHFLVWRDLAIRYRQTVLGFLWAFIQPFLKMVVFSAVFGGIAGIKSGGHPYPIFVYAGLLPWHFFSQCIARCSESVVNNSMIIRRVYFPRLLIPLSAIGATLADFAISFVILLGMMIYYRVVPSASVLMVIPLTLLTVLTSLGVGLSLSALNVAYRDFKLATPFLIQIWLFLTPVIYPVTSVPANWRWLLMLNPMSGIVGGFRSALLGDPFAWGDMGISLGIGAALLIVGLLHFRRTERWFADIV